MGLLPFLVSGAALLLALLVGAALVDAGRPDETGDSRPDDRPGSEIVKR
jgi:hypothetical protein